jgi:hypothetical protein
VVVVVVEERVQLPRAAPQELVALVDFLLAVVVVVVLLSIPPQQVAVALEALVQ